MGHPSTRTCLSCGRPVWFHNLLGRWLHDTVGTHDTYDHWPRVWSAGMRP